MEKTLERTYNVPLRKGFLKAPKYKRAKKAIIVLKEFLARHMKCDIEDIKLGRKINEKIWERGYKYPPHHIKITAVKDEKGIVKAELYGFQYEEPIVPEEVETEKKEEKKTKENTEEKTSEELEQTEKETQEQEDIDENKESKEDEEKPVKKKKKTDKKNKTSEKKQSKETKEKKVKEEKPKKSETTKKKSKEE